MLLLFEEFGGLPSEKMLPTLQREGKPLKDFYLTGITGAWADNSRAFWSPFHSYWRWMDNKIVKMKISWKPVKEATDATA